MMPYWFLSLLWGGFVCAAGSLELNGSVGGNITIHCGVKVLGTLVHNGVTMMYVKDNVGESYSENPNKYQWNNTTGCFTITDLEKADGGNVTITFSNRTSVTYQLIVYDSVAPPAVQTLSVSSDSCYLLCAVDKAAEITLWWYKDQEVVNQSSSAGSLPLTVTKQDLNSSYRCVAGNPAENKTLLVDLHKACAENFTNSSSENNHRYDWIIIGVLAGCAGLLLALAAFSILRKYFGTNKTPQGSVRYVIGNTSPDDQNQGEDEGGNDDSCHVMLNGDTQDT